MNRALITGAAGFIGRSLADRLRRDGVEVVGVDLAADDALGVVAGDIRWPGEWQRAAAGCDVMIHTAALVGMPSDTSRFWDVNVNGTHTGCWTGPRAWTSTTACGVPRRGCGRWD